MEGYPALFERAHDGAAYDYAVATRAGVHDAYRRAGYLLGDAGEAQDAVQDALVRAGLVPRAQPKCRRSE